MPSRPGYFIAHPLHIQALERLKYTPEFIKRVNMRVVSITFSMFQKILA